MSLDSRIAHIVGTAVGIVTAATGVVDTKHAVVSAALVAAGSLVTLVVNAVKIATDRKVSAASITHIGSQFEADMPTFKTDIATVKAAAADIPGLTQLATDHTDQLNTLNRAISEIDERVKAVATLFTQPRPA